MPPKKNPSPPDAEGEASLADMLRSMSVQLNSLTSKIETMDSKIVTMDAKLVKLDHIDTEVKSLRVLMNDLKEENKQLKQEARVTERKLSDMNERNNQLENRLNSLEQHHRGWSARVTNIPLTPEEESNNIAVANKVYACVLLPILRGAVERNLLTELPTVNQLLEVAHILPGKAGSPKPIIMRFFNRNTKDLIFKLKKFYAPRVNNERAGRGGGGSNGGVVGVGGGSGGQRRSGGEDPEEAGGFEGRGKYAFPLYEDLTRATFKKMRAIADDSRVKACWSVKGQLKFVLHSSPNEVRKVISLLDSLDTILE
jgi:FtsZ-binding cell division protein ZapB